ncbi:MAG: hypothetical protein ACKN9V_03435 [Pseudomonadota bacterium]
MRYFRFLNLVALTLTSILLSSCNIETNGVTLTVNSGSLTCAATTSLSSVVSGQTFPVSIQVIGGAAPYTLSGTTGTFLTTYSLPQTLTNTTNTSQVRTSNFTVTDSAGRSTTCQLAITVVPETTSNPLSCSVAASTETPALNQNVTYTATAAGGSGTYFFTGFLPGGNGENTASLTQTSATQATAGARYPSAGFNTSVFYISDSLGNSATCAKTVNVQSSASVSLSASPATTVPANQAIVLTAIPSNFSSTPTYTWSISGAGLEMAAGGNTAWITAIDSLTTRTGTVTVTATAGSQSATNTIPLTFTANITTLNCTLSYTPGTYTTGQNVPFNISASTGELLTVTQINVTDGYVVGGVPSQNPILNFYSSGSKIVTALARSTSTGIQCNNGAFLQTTINISSSTTPFSCSLSMTPNPAPLYTYQYPYYYYTWILATINASGAQGGFWLESLTADYPTYMNTDASTSQDNIVGASSSAIYRYVYFTAAGTWKVTARLRDSTGRTATCYTYQTITNWGADYQPDPLTWPTFNGGDYNY